MIVFNLFYFQTLITNIRPSTSNTNQEYSNSAGMAAPGSSTTHQVVSTTRPLTGVKVTPQQMVNFNVKHFYLMNHN